ncbi:Senescence regulator [Melia azedarach]|uniref:Senescence regulator n=2 Tax=Melia azedarach TaxID=155640 RepID=A0ACC1WZ63_MELAZ|nr:Senescence regulator [Melia azedarach]KAJ4703933.1 Senescence regulator [Melia azedarach]
MVMVMTAAPTCRTSEKKTSGSTVDDVGDRNDEVVVNNSRNEWSPRAGGGETNGSFPSRSRRRNPREDHHVGGLSLAFEESGKTAAPRIVHQFRGSDSVAASPRGHQHGDVSAVKRS